MRRISGGWSFKISMGTFFDRRNVMENGSSGCFRMTRCRRWDERAGLFQNGTFIWKLAESQFPIFLHLLWWCCHLFVEGEKIKSFKRMRQGGVWSRVMQEKEMKNLMMLQLPIIQESQQEFIIKTLVLTSAPSRLNSKVYPFHLGCLKLYSLLTGQTKKLNIIMSSRLYYQKLEKICIRQLFRKWDLGWDRRVGLCQHVNECTRKWTFP